MLVNFDKQAIVNNSFPFVSLAGFRSRTSDDNFGGETLFCSLVIFNKTFAIVSVDVLYISDQLYSYISELLLDFASIQRQNIIVNATHTHSAPNISSPIFGTLDSGFLDAVKSALTRCVDNALKIDMECDVYFSKENQLSDIVAYRRKLSLDLKSLFLKRKALLLPERKMQGVYSFNKLSFYCGKVEKLSILGLSCHPVFSTSNCISSDFPGELIHKYEALVKTKAFFVQGWSGDLRPNSTGSILKARTKGELFKALTNKSVFIKTRKKFYDYFICRLLKLSTENNSQRLDVGSIRSDKKFFVLKSKSGLTEKLFFVNVLFFSNVLLVSMPAEVSSLYYKNLSNDFNRLEIFPFGCSNGMIGYLPFHTQCRELGYEVESSTNYGWDSPICEESLLSFYLDLKTFINECVYAN